MLVVHINVNKGSQRCCHSLCRLNYDFRQNVNLDVGVGTTEQDCDVILDHDDSSLKDETTK